MVKSSSVAIKLTPSHFSVRLKVFQDYTQLFTDRAASYHLAMTRSPRARVAEFEAVLQPLDNHPDGLVCDMPAGGGYLSDHLLPHLRYLGVEPVDAFVTSRHEGRIATVRAPLTAVPLPSRSVDYLVSLAGLHHELSLLSVFKEMKRLIRHGGRAVIADVAKGSAPGRFLNGFVAENNPQGHDGRFLDEKTSAVLESAGWIVVSDELVEVPWVFDSVGEAGAFCEKLFGIVDLPCEAIADALASKIGFEEKGHHVRLQWVLRRIVCEPG